MKTDFYNKLSSVQQVRVFDAASLETSLKSSWERIRTNESAFAHPHFSPQFVIAAAKAVSGVRVAVVYDGREAVGFFAFQQDGKVGWPVAYPFNEAHGLVHSPSLRIEGRELCRQAGLRAWHFDHLPVSQKWTQPYQKAHDEAAWIELPESYEAYLEDRRASGTSQLKQAERKRRKLAREVGPVRYVNQVNCHDLIDALVEWKRAQIISQQAGTDFESGFTKRLLREILAIQESNVCGQLSVLYAGNRPVALHFGMRCRSTYVSMIPAHDPEFARYSPGLILHLEMIRAACEQGVTEIDLGRGINRVKAALMTTTRKLAMGSIDRRPFHRIATNSWYRLRNFAHSSKFGNRLLMLSRQWKRR